MNVQIIDFVAWQLNKNTGGQTEFESFCQTKIQNLEIVLMS